MRVSVQQVYVRICLRHCLMKGRSAVDVPGQKPYLCLKSDGTISYLLCQTAAVCPGASPRVETPCFVYKAVSFLKICVWILLPQGPETDTQELRKLEQLCTRNHCFSLLERFRGIVVTGSPL